MLELKLQVEPAGPGTIAEILRLAIRRGNRQIGSLEGRVGHLRRRTEEKLFKVLEEE